MDERIRWNGCDRLVLESSSCLPPANFDWSLRIIRDTPTRRRLPLIVRKRTFNEYQCDEKRGASTARSGGEVNATTIRRIPPRGAEWPLRADVSLTVAMAVWRPACTDVSDDNYGCVAPKQCGRIGR